MKNGKLCFGKYTLDVPNRTPNKNEDTVKFCHQKIATRFAALISDIKYLRIAFSVQATFLFLFTKQCSDQPSESHVLNSI